MNHIDQYFEDAIAILKKIDKGQIEKMIEILLNVRKHHGRLFMLGVGGSAGNCIHAVNDFRKLAGIETYSPAENIAELTARTNDEGWETVFSEWLKCSRLNEKDAVFVLSVGGGGKENNISTNIVYALDVAKEKKAKIMGVVSRDGGYTAKMADACVIVPPINPNTITPHAESFQGTIWHLIVSHPELQKFEMKWESVKNFK